MKTLDEQVKQMQRQLSENPPRNKKQRPPHREMTSEQRAVYSAEFKHARAYLEEQEELRQAQAVECLTCDGRGVVVGSNLPIDHPKFGKFLPCPDCEAGQRRIDRAWEARLTNSGLPAHYQVLTFQSWDDLPEELRGDKWIAREIAARFVTSPEHYTVLGDVYDEFDISHSGVWALYKPRNSLVFFGPLGVGKTGLAAAIFNAMLAGGKNVLYVRAHDMIADVRKDEFQEGEEGGRVIRAIQEAAILMIDEANMQKYSPYSRQVMENVLRYRHGHRLPTVVTTNLDREGFLDAWGDRCEVLAEMAHWVPVLGVKLRGVT